MIDIPVNIPPVRIPTPEESRATAIKWYEQQKGTLLNELPLDVLELSTPTLFFDFPIEEFKNIYEGRNEKLLNAMYRHIDETIGWNNKFWKLNTRSPKDVWDGDGYTCSAKTALSWILQSERTLDDLVYFTHLFGVIHPVICVRDPLFSVEGFGRWEFRCFVKDGELIALTDYDYRKPNEHIASNKNLKSHTWSEITQFYCLLKPRMHLDTYVFDVVKTSQGMRLIEINPYGLSDPCFFTNYENVENADPYDIATEFKTNE